MTRLEYGLHVLERPVLGKEAEEPEGLYAHVAQESKNELGESCFSLLRDTCKSPPQLSLKFPKLIHKNPKLLDSSSSPLLSSFSFSSMKAAFERMRQSTHKGKIEPEVHMGDLRTALEEVKTIKDDARRGVVHGGGALQTTMKRVWAAFHSLPGLSKCGGGPPSNDRDRQYGA